MMLDNKAIDNGPEADILTPEEVAQFFRKSPSWVYKNWKELGGRKLGGSLLFPKKEDLYERLFHQREGVTIRFHPKRNQAHRSLVQNQSQGKKGRSKKKGGDTKSENKKEDCPNRHGILDDC